MDHPPTDPLDVVTGPVPVPYRHAWITPTVTTVAVGSWFAGLAWILTVTR